MLNSFVMAIGITFGKIFISLLAAYAMIFFDFPLKKISFWMVFFTLMLPVEVRILPTYEIIADVFSPLKSICSLFGVELDVSLSLLNSYAGLTLPLIASATATFLFRQFFLTLPDELSEAAKIDGASSWQFFTKIVLPLSKTNIAALTVIVFVYGWNQYLWPLLITTNPDMNTAIIGVQQLIPKVDEAPEWNIAMAGTLIVMVPPILVVMFLQKYFVKGLIENEK
jgi:sn-glycerol 3-phosphate transport system permease protein